MQISSGFLGPERFELQDEDLQRVQEPKPPPEPAGQLVQHRNSRVEDYSHTFANSRKVFQPRPALLTPAQEQLLQGPEHILRRRRPADHHRAAVHLPSGHNSADSSAPCGSYQEINVASQHGEPPLRYPLGNVADPRGGGAGGAHSTHYLP